MKAQTLTITAPQLLSIFFHRGWSHSTKTFQFILVLFFTFLCLATFGSISIHGMQKSAVYDACRSYEDKQWAGFHDIIGGDSNPGYITRNSMNDLNVESVCTNSNLFCFPSTLSGFLPKELKLNSDALEVSEMASDGPLHVESMQTSRWASNKTWASDYGMFELLNGRTISCSINSKESIHKLSSIQNDCGNQNDFSLCRGTLTSQKSANVRLNKNSEMSKPGCLDVSSAPNVEILPPVLDWGQKYLFSPSVAFLTVANSCNDSILHVYEPFSTNKQFYPCNFSNIFLGPGEVASICFVFLPRWLGLSTSHLILQTNSGGFLVAAKGFAVESPYKIQPLMNLDVSPSGRLSKNFSLFNPFDETLHVEEVTAWISVLGNTTHHTEAVCSVEKFENSNEFRRMSVNDWLVVKNGQVGFPLTAMRPYRTWEISPQSSETIMEIDFSFGLKGKFFGAFCIQLLRSSHNKSDTVMIPLEVDLNKKEAYDDLTGPVSVSIESLVSCDSGGTFVTISLRNEAPYMLRFVKIADPKLFQIKYMEGLLLFPGTVTQVAVVTCSQFPVESHNSHPEVSNINKNCKILILTNESISPQIEIPCQDIIHVCLRHQKDSSTGYEHESEHVEYGNTRKGSFGGRMQSPSEIKALETAEADELVLENWKSQGATSGMSVLDDHELLFPVVQVGTHRSKWITVRNPSQQPVVMQLILNSGEIIDECRGTDDFVQPPSCGSMVHSKSAKPTRYGFSIAESALTEAYVHPYGRASFGPIFFHPSNRCSWRSSALIRNNLSGVEWLSLRGFGGSLSLVLLEGSEPVETVEFNLNLPVPHNITPPDMLFHMEETICSQSLSKELYAKNTGDLPLEVKGIEVSGTECRLDGFMVHTCTGFSLEPGESTKLLISYQTDFSSATVHRDLELALATGIFVIPMKASLPVFILNLCKKSVFWMRLKKFSLAVLLIVSLMFLAFCYLYLQMTALGSQDFFYKSEKSSITEVRSAGKSPRVQRNQRNSKFSVPAEMGCLLGSVGEDKTLKQTSISKYPDSQNRVPEQEMTTQEERSTLENHNHTFSDAQKDGALSSLPSKSIVVENSDIMEASQTCNLTVRTGKEKGKRRRKRKGAGAVLTGLLDVSSSQSGNSTPSSPLSPVIFVVPNRAWSLSPEADQPNESRYPFTRRADQHCEKSRVPESLSEAKELEPQLPVKCHSNNWNLSTREKPSAPRKTASKPVLLPSATFPSAGRTAPSMFCSSPSLSSTSKIAPHARAPGSKLYNLNTVGGDQAGVRDEYTYDIWGDHFSGLRLIGKTKDVTSLSFNAAENNSDSFFVRGPQTLVTNSLSTSVSCFNQEGK
ncbi:hypothetical protein Ddye_010481 [Dipteronia dyeriana]|uniref:Transmembrane protein 131-like N-terminal domain-containing protein n=1 Tax=Dipteronia dyeriana TaxID=168575 RepID=A0AAE0CND2_9ROSI|nr:hypothetical protein Ddye_010481 [Dipteronia dyeriana]